ncbi:MAG: hypothetical protein H6755_06320 [Candidatus Omnitrophica bacterium]|nr:hypothetical protein [Candidatus Omnitrophota bacterium]
MLIYDAFNRRISKTVDGVTTYFVYNDDSVIAEYDSSGSLNAEYVLGDSIDEVLTMERGSNDYYYHYDGLGSVSEMTDNTGAVVESYTYDAFGNPSIFDASHQQLATSNINNPYMFTGRRWDEETGIYYYRARQYDPLIGRFLQRDPLGYFDSMNLYAYTLNNPINFIDPYGLYSWYDFLRDSSNFSAGFGDTITFGGTNYIREIGEFNDVVDKCSNAYSAGGYTATGAELTLGGAGIAKATSKAGIKTGIKGGEIFFKNDGKVNFRINPFGSRNSSNPLGRLPHYHRRIVDPKTGITKPGGGIGRHRPWEGF